MRNRARFVFLLPLVFTLLMPAFCSAAGGIFIQAVGSVQGNIQGEAVEPSHPNWIEVFSFSHGIITPTGPNGLPTGPPQTSPLNIMVAFDRSTVKMYKANASGETFSNFTMEWVNAAGATTIRFQLLNARLVDVQESGSSGGDPRPTVSMSFTYSQITITDVLQGTSVSYNWNTVTATTAQTLAKGTLLPPAPNPTRGPTEFRFSLPAASDADLTLFDLRGRVVRELHHGWTSTEQTVAVWDGTDDLGVEVAQGLYVARLTYPGMVVTQRIALVR